MSLLFPNLRIFTKQARTLTDGPTRKVAQNIEDWLTDVALQLAKADATSVSSGGVPATRRIDTVLPLTGGGDLSANRVLNVNTFGSGASGVVPASGGGTVNYLRADVTWANPVAGYSSGTGTPNRLAKFTGSGNTIGDSTVSDNGTTVTVTGGQLAITGFTAGSVLFAGASGLVSQDNSNFFWDDTNDRLGLGVAAAPATTLDVKNAAAAVGGIQSVLTNTSNTVPAVTVVNASSTAGAMSIKNTNASGPVDFYVNDSTGATKFSFGYGNASYSDTARQGRAYIWRNTGVNTVIARTNTVDAFIDSSGRFGIGTGTSLTGLLEVNAATPDIFINGSTSGLLRYSGNGATAPTFTTRSAGAKIVLFPSIDGTHVDYGLGIEPATMWHTVPQNAGGFLYKWYGGTTRWMQLADNGAMTLGAATDILHTISGRAALTNTNATGNAVTSTHTPVAGTTDALSAGVFTSNGTYNTTAGVLSQYGIRSLISATRSSGANNLQNFAVYANASGGQSNWAFYNDNGDNNFNVGSGKTAVGPASSTAKLSVIADTNANACEFYSNRTGQTSSPAIVYVHSDGSLDTTAASRNSFAVNAQSLATRSAGANDLINYGVYATASNAQQNYALHTDLGDNRLNFLGGLTQIGGSLATGGQLNVRGSATAAIYAVNAFWDATGLTSDQGGVRAEFTGSSNCTAAARLTTAISVSNGQTKSAGANTLTNRGIDIDVFNGDTNEALRTRRGNVEFNITSGTFIVNGAATIKNTLDMTSHLINNVTDPSAAQDAATKNYVDTKAYRLLGRQVFTSNGTYTPTTGTKRVLVQMSGGGGGGGGAGGGGNRAVGSGGGSGVYWEKFIDPAATVTGGSVTIGAAGAAGASTGGTGGTGGDTSIVVNSTTYTAKGGTGGVGSTSGTVQAPTPGKPQTGSSASDYEGGNPGQFGLNLDASALQYGGGGGGNDMGAGGGGSASLGAGAAGMGHGGGGAGANATVSNTAGGAGTAGQVIVWEYA